MNKEKGYNNVKKLLWLYIILLLIEGALRKWIFPSLATPLLVVRDPVALWIMLLALKYNILKFDLYIGTLFIVAFLSIPIAVYMGHGNIFVAIYGARIFILHLPLVFLMGIVFTRDDVIKFGKIIVYFLVPMTALIVAQFYSPQTSFVNRGVGGDETGGGFSGANGFYRPPGIFSFTSGNVMYYSVATCFVLWFWVAEKRFIDSKILVCSTIAFIIAIPMSISRSLVFQVFIAIIFMVATLTKRPKILGRLFSGLFLILLIFYFLKDISFFSTAIDAFNTRFDSASTAEGGINGTIFDRFLGGLFGAIFNNPSIPYFGYGIGLGTNVGAMVTTGTTGFIVAEGEWGRMIGEMGFIFGMSIIILRVTLSFQLLTSSYKEIGNNNILPWMLMSYTFLSIIQNQLGQPTSLGFTVLVGGLAMASLKSNNTTQRK